MFSGRYNKRHPVFWFPGARLGIGYAFAAGLDVPFITDVADLTIPAMSDRSVGIIIVLPSFASFPNSPITSIVFTFDNGLLNTGNNTGQSEYCKHVFVTLDHFNRPAAMRFITEIFRRITFLGADLILFNSLLLSL